jgi:hypothetical protein
VTIWKLTWITIFAIPLGGWQFAEWWHAHQAKRYPLVEGHVINRTEFRRWGGIPAGRLTIRSSAVAGDVVAEVPKYAMEQIPDDVRFHYSGDPTREVYLEGESNPFWAVVIFWGMPPVLWALYFAKGRTYPVRPQVTSSRS